jgi:serine/threonine protein kinase
MAEDRMKTVEDPVDSFAPTLASSPSGDSRSVAPPSDATFEITRYTRKRVLGAGGMGEVRLCEDAWIGRDVAMKVARPGAGGSAAQTRGRFLREARVQGQLEHPGIVPVYDIGKLDGETFFTMKRIGGHTLEQIVAGLREGRPEIVAKYNRRKLLAAASQVCLTVAYAHSRGVVHRDLKPANVMLGDFGEVYVLDWGVARLESHDGRSEPVLPDPSGPDVAEGAVTQAGAIIGTPGYMAPEQLRGESATPRSDVYALGAMLFELLALEPLHKGKTVEALTVSTMRPAPLPTERGANVSPELDELVGRATAREPGERFESARAMHEAIEAFLDGERDAERRRALARDHVERGRAALAKATQPGEDGEARRAEGMRELGRAVALDPTDEGALRAIREIVLAPAADLPRAAQDELRAIERRDRARAAGRASNMYIVWLALIPLVWLTGVRSFGALAAIVVSVVAVAAYARWVASVPERATSGRLFGAMVLNTVLIGACTTIFGPFVLVPGVAASSAAAFVLAVREKSVWRQAPFVLAALAVFVPLALEEVGVLPRSFTFADGAITIHPVVTHFRVTLTFVQLVIVTLVQLLLPAVLINRAVDALVDAEHRNFAQAWRLRQLLP